MYYIVSVEITNKKKALTINLIKISHLQLPSQKIVYLHILSTDYGPGTSVWVASGFHYEVSLILISPLYLLFKEGNNISS